jgi:hypothetical protein
LGYTIYSYTVFRGKITKEGHYYWFPLTESSLIFSISEEFNITICLYIQSQNFYFYF